MPMLVQRIVFDANSCHCINMIMQYIYPLGIRRFWINVNDVDSTLQQRRVPSG